MAIQVALRDQPAAVIVAGSPDAGTYTDVEVTVAAALVEQGTVAYDNAQLFSRVQELATTDQLTGVATRRHFWDLAEQQCAAAQRHGRPLAAVMLDLDHFKVINDTHGHATGDAVLRELSARLRSLVRESDILGRYGGEEFALLLPETEDASALAERLRATVADAAVPADHEWLHVTVSLGVSYLQPDDDLNSLLGRADAALYRAKAAGRNRVSVA
jgi:diguanylate cyclase (GGDEF)-like protein